MNREAIAEAVFGKLTSASGLRSSGRIPKPFDQITATDCPALYMGVGSSESVGTPGPRAKWRMEFLAYVYCNDGSISGPSIQLNEFLAAIDAAFLADETELAIPGASPNHTTLGGLALYARPTHVQTDEGSFGDLGVAIVTIVTIEVVTAG